MARTDFRESVKYEIEIGVPNNTEVPIIMDFQGTKFVRDWKKIEFIDEIKRNWQSYAKSFYEATGVHISAIAVPGNEIYIGSTDEGARVLRFHCTANPIINQDMDKYEEGVLYITEMIKNTFGLNFVTITKIPVTICSLLTVSDQVQANESGGTE